MSTDTESSFSPADLVQSTFEAISDAIFVVALPERTIAHCNAAAAEMFGYERDALVGSNTECIHVDETNWEEFHEESIEPLEKQGYFRAEFEMKRSVVQDVTVQKHYERELQNRALEDGLTGLPNRTLFRDRLEYALERSEQSDGSVAVAFLDLDRFQIVNKTLGHAAGDTLLKRVANRLTREVEDLVTVARFGADEFALLFEGVETSADAESRCRDLVDAVTEPLEIADTVIHPEISAGVAIGAPDDCPGDLLRYAEAALSNAERSDRASVDCYHRERDSADARELHREHALRRAVEEREFAVRYQPVVDLATGEPVGAEALVRWDHPEHGILSPAEFLDAAEETGLIVPIGYQVLERATADVADWLDERPGGREDDPFRLAVNLSPTQYRAPDVVDRIREVAADSGLPLERLVLEITENILVTSNGKLASLRDDDVRVAIDDFGTGYASLQYLRQLDADELKIDRSFLRGLESGSREYTLVEAILGIGRSCDLTVIAEGIETDEQRRHLVDMGATLGQGYYFARPMSAGAFASRYFTEPS